MTKLEAQKYLKIYYDDSSRFLHNAISNVSDEIASDSFDSVVSDVSYMNHVYCMFVRQALMLRSLADLEDDADCPEDFVGYISTFEHWN